MTNEEIKNITSESLRDWFKKEKWVRISSSGNIAGDCGTSKNKKNPDRCLPKAKAQSLSKAQRAATARKKKKAGAKGKTVVKNTKAAKVTKETANPQDGKAAPYGSGYKPTKKMEEKFKRPSIQGLKRKLRKSITKEDVKNLVIGTVAELQQKEDVLQEDDRCTRLAKSKYDTWPSAYASGAVVRCRRGEIWKKK